MEIVLFSCSTSAEKTDNGGFSGGGVGGGGGGGGVHGVMSDPLAQLAKQMGGSKRNALLKWCQSKTTTYSVSTEILMAPSQVPEQFCIF